MKRSAAVMAGSQPGTGNVSSNGTLATDYRKIPTVRLPQIANRETSETRYWKRFANPVIETHTAQVTHVNCSQTAPYDYAVSTSTRVVVYNGKTGKVRRQLTRFKSLAYSGSLRKDGKLLVAGGEDPKIQVFDINSRVVLRSMLGHSTAVRCTQWSPDSTHILSCSDDKTVRYWDLTTGKNLFTMLGHTDYIRSAAVNASSSDVWCTGSYDHTVRLWDTRIGEATVAVDHGAPVESVLMLPGGSLMVSAGGQNVKVWDVLGGGRLLNTFSYHRKTITSVSCDGSGKRILTGSLDGMVKVCDMNTFKVTASIKYGGPILSLDMNPENSKLIVGMSTGELNVRTRPVQTDASKLVSSNGVPRNPSVGTYQYFNRGTRIKNGNAEDTIVRNKKKAKLQAHDAFLKQFKFKAALDAALASKQPETVVSLLEELLQRSCLEAAFSGRDEEQLEPLLSFLNRYVTNPRYSSLLMDVCAVLFSLYMSALGHSLIIDEAFQKLSRQLKEEIKLQRSLHKIQGTLDLLFAAQQ